MQRSIEPEIMPTCARLGMGQIVWSPLAQGLLTGKYADGRIPPGSRAADEQRNRFLKPLLTPENLGRASQLASVARDLADAGATRPGLVLRRPEVSAAIVGPRASSS